MYSINSLGKISLITENFKDTKNCENEIIKDVITINNANQIQNIDTDCMVVPSKVYNGNNKKPFILSTVNRDCEDMNCSKGGHHSFQIFPFNLPENIIYIDTIKPNFFCIVNTKNMNSDGEIKLLNKNSTIKIIKINDLNNNNDKIKTKDKNGNLCSNPKDNNSITKFTINKTDPIVTSLKFEKNPVIYFFGDYNACDMSQQTSINNLYVYFDYGNYKDLKSCLNKMIFNIVNSGNKTIDFLMPFSMHGTQFNDKVSKNFKINFDPRDISTKDGFITIINTQETIEKFEDIKSLYELFKKFNGTLKNFVITKNISNEDIQNYINKYKPNNNETTDEDLFAFELSNLALNSIIIASVEKFENAKAQNKETIGSVSFDTSLLNKIYKLKRSCLLVKFWLVSFNFKNNKIIDIKNKKGPYRYINFIGNPKIIIYIPPYLFKNDDEKHKKALTSYYQTNQNECNIYVSITY